MKTIKQWLKTLPEPYRTKAIKNLIPGHDMVLSDNLKGALVRAFLWDETPEGGIYWTILYKSL